MQIMYGGDLLAGTLAQEGVDHFIGVTGGQMLSLFDAVERNPGLKLVVPRNEAAGAMIADGYSRATGNVAVVMSTVGAGAVYSVAGTANAWADHVPVFSISPQVQSWKMYPQQESLQGCYQADMFAGVTRWNCTAYNWKRIPRLVQRGLREALSGERGPVHMDIPVDTFFAFQPVTKARFRRLAAAPGSSRFSGSFLPGGEALKEALSLLETAEKPIIAAGLSVLREGAWNALSALADSLPAPVGVTSAALTALTQDHPSYIGVLGHPALDNIPEAVKKADLLITVGTTIGEGEEIMEMVDRRRTRVIQTSPEPELLGALGPVEGALVGDASSICTVLQKCTAGKAAERNKWLKACRKTCDDTLKNLRDKTSENRAGAAVKALSEVMSPEDLVVFDGRESSYWGPLLCRTKSNNSQFQSRGLKGNGYGLPMAMGVKLAHPKRRMIALCDSSALIQHIQELNTSLREGIAVTICAVGEPMDWSKVAEGFGTNSVEAHSHGELAEALRKGNVSESIIINLTGY